MITEYLPILILLVIALGFGLLNLLLTHLFGPRRPNPIKLSPYESGVPPLGDARLRFSIKFYLVAMIFIIFDIEVVFMYPWAVVYRDLLSEGSLIFWEMFVFIGVLLIGFVYVWRRGGLEWD